MSKTNERDEGHTALHSSGALIKVTLHDGPDGCLGRMAGKMLGLMNVFLCFKEKVHSNALCSIALCFLLVLGAPSAEELTITAIPSRVKMRHLCSLFF